MNTPRTKKPKRYDRAKVGRPERPDGRFAMDLQDGNFLNHLGAIASRWPHVEEKMTLVLGDLLGIIDPNIPLRPLFRSIINAKTRIDILRNLLQKSQFNAKREAEYDEVIDEFAAVNSLRNTYLHALWSTHESGRVYIAEASADDIWFLESREIKIEELTTVLHRINGLHDRLFKLHQKRTQKHLASFQKPPQPLDEGAP